jgi:hypothetical protein
LMELSIEQCLMNISEFFLFLVCGLVI